MSKEMMDFFGFSEELATTSAFVQKRVKILPEAFESLFALFTNKFAEAKTYRGFQLLAVDGSDFLIMREWTSRKTPSASGNIIKISPMGAEKDTLARKQVCFFRKKSKTIRPARNQSEKRY